jgi:hypothetical protein
METVINVYFTAGSFENKKCGEAILVDLSNYSVNDIIPKKKKNSDEFVTNKVVDEVKILSREFKKENFNVPCFNCGQSGELAEKLVMANKKNIDTLIKRGISLRLSLLLLNTRNFIKDFILVLLLRTLHSNFLTYFTL